MLICGANKYIFIGNVKFTLELKWNTINYSLKKFVTTRMYTEGTTIWLKKHW